MRRRVLVTLLGLAPVLATLGLAIASLPSNERVFTTPCRVFSNDLVPFVATTGRDCPLRRYDRVIGFDVDALEAAAPTDLLAVRVERSGVIRTAELPVLELEPGAAFWELLTAVLISGVMVGVALVLLWRTRVSAAVPFLFLYAACSTFLIAATASPYCASCARAESIALGALPGILVHFGLTFPRERGLIRRRPQLLYAVYALNLVLLFLALTNFSRAPAVWATADSLLLALCLVAWLLVSTACGLALRESESVRERARARALLIGIVAVPSALVAIGILWGSSLPGGQLALTRYAAWFLPLPIGYAIVQHRLFDLGHAESRPIAYMTFVALSASGVCAACLLVSHIFDTSLPLETTARLYSVFFIGFLVTDVPRLGLWRFLNGLLSSWTAAVRRLSASHAAQVGQLLEPHDCARILCETIYDGLRPAGVSVFIRADTGWQLAYALGRDAALSPALAEAALEQDREGEVVYLADDAAARGSERLLRDARVEVVGFLGSGKDVLGVALLTASTRGRPYTSHHLDFLATLLRSSALAIHNADLARDLVSSERFATQGRIRAGLLHDFGKLLGVVLKLAQRLPERSPERLRQDARTIEQLTGEALSSIRRTLEDGDTGGGARDAGEALPLDVLVDRVLRTLDEGREGARDRVAVCLAPGLPAIRRARDRLSRILANLLDNACRSLGPAGLVRLSVTIDGAQLCIEVADDGCGMSPAVADRAFEPFFTTRTSAGGIGLGLATCRALVAELEGSIQLSSQQGTGTSVSVRIPLERC